MFSRENIIDRTQGALYGIAMLVDIKELDRPEFLVLKHCIRTAVGLVSEWVGRMDGKTDFSYSTVGAALRDNIDYQQEWKALTDDGQSALTVYTRLLVRLMTEDVKYIKELRSSVASVMSECEEERGEAVAGNRLMMAFDKALRDLYDCWNGEGWPFYFQWILNSLGLELDMEKKVSACSEVLMLGSIAGVMSGRHNLLAVYHGAERIGAGELKLSLEAAGMWRPDAVVASRNEGFFTNILIVSDSEDEEADEMRQYMSLQYPHGTVRNLKCVGESVEAMQQISQHVTDYPTDLIISLRGTASVVCQFRDMPKILIFPRFNDLWPLPDGMSREEALFGGLTARQRGTVYGIFGSREEEAGNEDYRLYWDQFKSGERGYVSGQVTSLMLDRLGYTIWNLCTQTVLSDYKPRP